MRKLTLLTYPATVTELHEHRKRYEQAAQDDPQTRAAIRKYCRQDILWWINTTCWIYEPRQAQQHALGFHSANLYFSTWEYQEKYIQWLCEHIDDGLDGLTEKSRDMGASWLVATVLQWYWQFGGPGNDFLIGSRKEEFVDKIGSMDALFPKLRYQLRRQPRYLLPEGFDITKHASYLRLVNPETDSMIKGEANNQYFGSGGRYKAVLLDEFAKWEHTDEAAWQSLSDATPCRLPTSSANGRTNHFYQLRSQNVGDIDTYTLHWTQHPLKDTAWYEAEQKRRSPQDLAAEVDIDYTASISNKAWPSFGYPTHVTTSPLYEPDMPIVLTCDFNIEPMSWILAHEQPPMTVVFDELVSSERTRTEDHILEFVELYKDHRVKVIELYGDATGRYGHTAARHSNYQIIKRVLKDYGWQINDHVPQSNPPVSERLDASNKRLKDWAHDNTAYVVIQSHCTHLINSLEQTRRKGDGIDKSDDVDHPGEAWSYYEVQRHQLRQPAVVQGVPR